MGYNARQDAVLQTLAARDGAAPLRRAVPVGGGVDAAMDVYAPFGPGD
jgi:(S)-ureidoglycine-glyoxylate aminotransferase